MHDIDVCRKAKQNDDRHTQTHTNGEFHTKRVVSPHETSWDTDTDGPAPKNDVLLDVYMRNTFLRQSPSTSINFDTRKNNGKQNDERHISKDVHSIPMVLVASGHTVMATLLITFPYPQERCQCSFRRLTAAPANAHIEVT